MKPVTRIQPQVLESISWRSYTRIFVYICINIFKYIYIIYDYLLVLKYMFILYVYIYIHFCVYTHCTAIVVFDM